MRRTANGRQAREHEPTTRDKLQLATSATAHCLLGCGIGEVVGVVIGTALAWSTVQTIVLAVILGFVFGFALGLVPLMRARFQLKDAVRQVLLAEGLSIAVMETAEVLVEVYTPVSWPLDSRVGYFGAGCSWRCSPDSSPRFLSTMS